MTDAQEAVTELPAERLGDEVVMLFEGEDPGGELVEIFEAAWGEELALDDGEADLD